VNRKELKELKEILLKQKERILKSIGYLEESTQKNARGNKSERAGVPTHLAELGTDTFEKDLDFNLTSSETELLEMIDESLKRIEEKKYGICDGCGTQIPKQRLKAIPYARYCIDCQKKREKTGGKY
jgi:RNA polymerase-binding protein DksA